MPTAETARLIASLELRDKNFTRGLKQVERGVGRVDKKLGAFSGAVNRNLTRAVDTLIDKGIDAGQAVIQSAIDQESAITGIAKTVNGNIDDIVDDLKKLSTQTGSSFTELAGIAELGGAMGIAKNDIAAFTEQVAILGATTNVSVEDAATALGQMGTIIGLTGDEFDNFAASLVDLGNKGNSTEAAILEIARRSGGAAKLFGIARDETLGWAAAAANLGLNEELAGTALQNLFVKAMPKFIKGSKTLEKVTGKTAKELKRAWEKDASGALQGLIADLGKLSEGEQLAAIQKLFGKSSGITRLMLGLVQNQDNLTDSLNTGTEAWKAGTAAQAEADKRFATSEFMFKRLNNSVNLAAATIGTELLPVLNELATEGIEWLQKPETQKAIKSFAVDLGKGLRQVVTTLKGVDWGKITSALGAVAGVGKEIVKAFLGLPDWAQAILVGGFAANKLTGGAVSSLVGELGKGLIKGVLGMNAGVVNINAGVVNGAGGVPGVAAGGRGIRGRLPGFGGLVAGTIAVTLTGEAIALQQQISQRSTEQAQTAHQSLTAMLQQNPKLEDMQTSLAAVNTGINQIQSNPLLVLVQGQALDELKAMRAELSKRIITAQAPANFEANQKSIASREGNNAGREPVKALEPKIQATTNAVKNAQSIASREASAQKTELGNLNNALATFKSTTSSENSQQKAELANIKNAAATQAAAQAARDLATQGRITTAGTQTSNAARSAGDRTSGAIGVLQGAVVRAIWGAAAAYQPIVQSTTVVQKYTVAQRGGATSDSRTRSGV